MEQKSSNKYLMRFIGALFIGFGLWWLYIAVFQRHVDPYNAVGNQSFSSTYGLMSLFGGLIGISASTSWGGHKSLIGRSLLFFSIGLLAQEFGQLAYSFYLYALQVKIPYPSVGDVGYLSSALFYIYASYLLLQANGARFSLKDRNKRIISVVLPLVLLGASYTFFLRDYQFDFSTFKSSLTAVLDIGYPLGQSIYISIALLTYLLSKNMLGGIMKRKVLFILFALVVQYIADFSFLEAAKAGKVFPAGANDFMYLISYTVMALALNEFRVKLAIKSQPESTPES